MNKFYTFVTLIVTLFLTTSASAQIQSVTELFGTWKFTADVQYNDDNYKSKILAESEVIIVKDPYGQFAAEIDGLCGVENSYQQVSKLVANEEGQQTLKITNPNGGNFDAWGNLGLWMTEVDGRNPFGATGYGSQYYVVSNDGKEITLPDFSFVSVSDWSAEYGTIVATVKNAKLTLIAKEEIDIKDLSGEYDFNVTQTYDYGVIENWPTSLKMNIVKKDDTNKNYSVTWVWEEFAPITFDGTFDGDALTLPYSKQVIAYDSIYLAPSYGDTLDGNIVFNLAGDNLSLSTGCSFAVPHYIEGSTELDSLSYIFWYGSGVAKLPKEKPSFTYDGKYKATAVVAHDLSEGKTPVSGPIEIMHDENYDMYLITNFLGYDTYYLNSGGIEFKPDPEDPLKGTIDLTYNYLQFLEETAADYKYYVLLDGNLSNGPIKVTFSEDGTMKLGEFCIGTSTFMGTEPNALVTWYTSLTAVPNNPAPEDWIGDHEVTPISFAYVADGFNVPTAKTFKVSYNDMWSMYMIDELFGYDVFSMNQGGIELKPDEKDPHKATIILEAAYNLLDFNVETLNAIALYDVNMKTTSIEATLNNDGTITLGDFSIAEGPWGGEPTSLLASTNALTSINDLKAKNQEGKTYNLMGSEVKGLQHGIIIQNVGGKFVKKYIK
ncbi:MAG: hypothetical protein MJZ20_00695 [Bacteroidaceae bacterium]|nr:hypothetical protein [Bacteroidaceae bacterium]